MERVLDDDTKLHVAPQRERRGRQLRCLALPAIPLWKAHFRVLNVADEEELDQDADVLVVDVLAGIRLQQSDLTPNVDTRDRIQGVQATPPNCQAKASPRERDGVVVAIPDDDLRHEARSR